MKPIFLSIQAFGPFSDNQNIDFKLLGESPLFLINGSTGAGKSSILDAICYALYGETTGNERTGDQMRCDYASPNLVTEVRFEFSLGQKRYQVTRSPDQYLPKKRGEGLTKRSHKAEFVELSIENQQLIASRPTEVNKCVRELIGLDAKQFRQVMVLPQGRFRELLTANSKERELIFGQLFQTHIYNAIERALFDQSAGIRKQKEGYDNQIKGVLDSANVENEDDLKNQKKAEEDALADFQQTYGTRKQQLEQAKLNEKKALETAAKFTELNDIKAKLLQHKSLSDQYREKEKRRNEAVRATYLNEHYQKVHDTKQLVTRYQNDSKNLSNQLVISSNAFSVAETELKAAKKQQQHIADYEQQLFTLKATKEKLIRVDECSNQRQEIANSISREKGELDSLRKSIERLSQSLVAKQAEYDKAKLAETQLPIKIQATEQLKSILSSLAEKESLNSQLESAQQVEQRLESSSLALVKKSEQVLVQTNEVEYQWHSSQAAVLATKLQIGQACPVCGSLEHPDIAEFSGVEVTLEVVEQSKVKLQTAVAEANKSKEQLSQQRVVTATLKQKMSSIEEQLVGCSYSTEEVTEELNNLAAEIRSIQSVSVTDLATQLEQLTAQQQVENKNEASQLEKVKQQEQELAAIEAKLLEIKRDVPEEYQSSQSVEKQIATIELTVSNIQKNVIAAEEKVQSASSQLTKVQAEQSQLTSLIQQAESDLTLHQSTLSQKLAESSFTDIQQYLNSCMTEQEVAEIDAWLNDYNQKAASLTALVSKLKHELSGCAQPNLAELAECTKQCEEQEKQAMQLVTSATSTLDRLQKAQQSLSVLQSQNIELEKQYQVVGTLSDVANGRTGAKVSLHRFVLGVLLDDVLILASKRLNKMTQGRYDLRRKLGRSKGNAGSGLELMVEDSYTGKLRDVATLSGGESFMAALSLALGLSDVVQSYSGGIRLDTLFIDEGFGSLDQESLDLAIQA